jgi:LmbE family N-acetylglucosaminyl deacetylase
VTHRLAAVFAHPDDDAYGVGGTIALERDHLDLTVILATSGEAGQISDPSLATPENLGQVREAEERAALAELGVPDAPVHFLGYPDGGVAGADRAELVDRVTELLGAARPQVVVTFGPEGVTKHDDHITIGQAATQAFHRARAGVDPGDAFEALYYSSIPQSGIDEFWSVMRQAGVDIGNPDDPFMPRGVPDETIAVRVDCRSVMDRKLAGIKAHRTQWAEFGMMPAEMQERFLREETFVQAWPPVTEPGGPPRASLFEDLQVE